MQFLKLKPSLRLKPSALKYQTLTQFSKAISPRPDLANRIWGPFITHVRPPPPPHAIWCFRCWAPLYPRGPWVKAALSISLNSAWITNTRRRHAASLVRDNHTHR